MQDLFAVYMPTADTIWTNHSSTWRRVNRLPDLASLNTPARSPLAILHDNVQLSSSSKD